MRVSTMRTLDRYLGIPFCWILAPVGLFSRKGNPGVVQRILVIKLFGMGSIILTSPALALLRSRFLEAEIDFLTFEANKEVAQRNGVINHVHAIRTTNFFAFFADTVQVVARLCRRKYDLVLDFEFFSKFSTLLSAITRAPRRVGFALPARWRSLLLTHQIELDKHRHVSASFIRQAGSRADTASPSGITPPLIYDDDCKSMETKLPLNGTPIVAVNVNASEIFPERRWPPARFAELVFRLSQNQKCVFYFIGIASEREYVQSVIDRCACRQRCYNIAGILTVPELAAFLQRCELLVSSDSGPVHLAASLGIPTVSLYGPESPEFYGPLYGPGVSIYKSISCSPCMNVYSAKSFQCPYGAQCMLEISVDEVLREVERILIPA